MYGNWETGPWFGFKLPGDDSYAWIGGGTKIFDFMVGFRWWVEAQFSNDELRLDLETHLLLYQQEDGEGETCGERSEVRGQDFPRGCGLDEKNH